MIARRILALVVVLFFLGPLSQAGTACAQEDSGGGAGAITFDQINTVAEKLYCPVCPNETLEDCQTQACVQWRAEIGEQLATGQSEQQVIDAFVQRYGERVVAIPQDPVLRALPVVTPYLLAGLALVVGAVTLLRWTRRSRPAIVAASPSAGPPGGADEDYRARLERDLHR
ncbi:MAG: cytochrome c-type biogenesis protein CcmH [Chloroflexi bacterium]|nr:cytochrome c-type biogenesis protein CcmH [Chloroflexota bacterium]